MPPKSSLVRGALRPCVISIRVAHGGLDGMPPNAWDDRRAVLRAIATAWDCFFPAAISRRMFSLTASRPDPWTNGTLDPY